MARYTAKTRGHKAVWVKEENVQHEKTEGEDGNEKVRRSGRSKG